MRKIIDGLRYDTEKATKIHDWSNGHYRNDFYYCCETLYRTGNGAFFLHGQGGALSKYGERCAQGMGASENIVPLLREDAIQWLLEHDGDEVVEEKFPDAFEEA